MLPRTAREFAVPAGRPRAAATLLAALCALFAAGCWGITSGPDQPDVSFDRDTANCEKQVKQCTCYCALRCGDTCVQRLCYDPCSDGRTPDVDPNDIRPSETGPRDVPPGPDSGRPDATDGGPTETGLDSGSPDTRPVDSGVRDTGTVDTGTGIDTGVPTDTLPRDTNSPTDGST